MRFWDSSAIVALLVREPTSSWAQRLWREDPSGLVWALSQVEVHSALRRRHREKRLSVQAFAAARRRALNTFSRLAHVVAVEQVADRALRVLDLHSLRAADALQLAAALVASQERPRVLPFVTLDSRLGEAAAREGFPLLTVE